MQQAQNATNATNADITNLNTETNAVINFQIGNGVAYNKTIENVENSNTIQNVDFSSSDIATFGNYIVPKLKLLSSETLTSTDTADSSTATFDESINTTDSLLVLCEIYGKGKNFQIINGTGTHRIESSTVFNNIAIISQCEISVSTSSIKVGKTYSWASSGSAIHAEASVYKVYKIIM